MTPEQKERLAALKKNKKDKIDALKFANQSIQPCLEVLGEFKQKRIKINKIFMDAIQQEWLPTLQILFMQAPYSQFNLLSVEQKSSFPILDDFFEKYPSVNPLRYVPNYPKLNDRLRFKDIITQFELTDTKVYFFYLRYAFVFQLSISELAKAEEDLLFNLYHGDVIIFPENLDWLLAFSLEEEWRFGKE